MSNDTNTAMGSSEIGQDANGNSGGIQKILARENANILKLNDPLDENNWPVWKERMKRALYLCGIDDYVSRTIARPDDPVQRTNWDYNDKYAQFVIQNNITNPEMLYVGQCKTADEMWMNLEAVHEAKGHQTVIAVIRNMFHTSADENANISDHLNVLKGYWERVNMMDDEDFRISDRFFKVIISSSLPANWDAFTDAYVGSRKGEKDSDPKKLMTSQQFIGILKEEYLHRVSRAKKGDTLSANQAMTGSNRSLANRLGAHPQGRGNGPPNANTASGGQLYCRQCGRRNHKTADCLYLGALSAIKCDNCGKYGHITKNCWGKGNPKCKRNDKENDKNSSNKKGKTEQASASIEEVEEEVTFVIEGGIRFDESEIGQYSGFKEYAIDPNNDERVLYYEWLADSATTLHICNRREAFENYQPANGTTITGVGNVKTDVLGHGTVVLYSRCEGRLYPLRLDNVLHIPGNRNNLLALGRWEQCGRSYECKEGILSLVNEHGKTVARGTKIKNSLYKMNLEPHERVGIKVTPNVTFASTDNSQTWETWHKRFGHISYSGLQKLYDQRLVEGFDVDLRSAKPDCVACTEAKMTVEPYKPAAKRQNDPGTLMHMDVWGKYQITSINGHQYYLLFVDDGTRYTTVTFLKGKDEASSKVRQYLAYLQTQGKRPQAMRVDHGTEFLNETLRTWCGDQGIEIQTTAPYSPSQNGVAERMNRMLVELTRAMIKAADLPKFLWEPAVQHAAYVRNRAFTKSLEGKTPYEAWHNKKPDVRSLREFGAPVWVLLQGQKEPRKILSKSTRRAFVGFEDGPKAMKYYSAESQKILTLQNYCFLTPQRNDTPPVEIVVTPDVPREGESRGSTQPLSDKTPEGKRPEGIDGVSLKRKWTEESEQKDLDELRKTRGR